MRISQVSERTGFSVDTLRYYERIGLIPSIHRNESGIRDYQEFDIKRIKFIKCMRRAGIPIEALIEYLGLVEQGDSTIDVRKKILIKQRDRISTKIEEMQETLDLLNHKIDVYEKALLKAEKELIALDV